MPCRQRGITLIELMIATTIALFALSVVLTVYSTTARHSTLHLQRTHLHQQLHATLHLIAGDVRRSGYWQFDPRTQSPGDNPFQNAVNDVRHAAYPGEAADSCILFAYDLDRDGLVGVGQCKGASCAQGEDEDNVEQFGFRLRDGAIQSRYGGTELSCNSGYWQAVTDPEIEITRFRFTRHIDCDNLAAQEQACSDTAPRLMRRAVELQMSGRQRRHPDVRLDISTWVRLRNDRLVEGAS
ncbi:MAG: prepilin-type N-terminal cleavage/methylation domain-containing protein [Thiogranum sp.]|nr:prepilin-type N-terminal cleavage/methylation domain-containing protein [Thiogranum sp.]